MLRKKEKVRKKKYVCIYKIEIKGSEWYQLCVCVEFGT